MYQAAIVDDEPYIVEGIQAVIDWEGFGFEIALATTSPAAVLTFLKSHPVHLLITDISMPELDGITLIKESKALHPLLAVIVLSSYDSFSYVKDALRYGAENYLLKPLEPDDLIDSVRNVVSHIKEREVITSNYGRTMLTFRSTFVEQWIKNLLSADTLSERAELLGINLEMDQYTAVIFTSPGQDSHAMSSFFDSLLSKLPGNLLGHFYFETPSRLVCIFSVLNPDITLSDFLENMLLKAKGMGLSMFAAVGETLPFYQRVFESYRQASSLLYMMHTDRLICTYEELLPSESQTLISLSLENCDAAGILSALSSLFYKYGEVRCIPTLLSCLVKALTPDIDDISVKYPGLRSLITALPSADASGEACLQYAAQLLDAYILLRNEQKQALYPCVDSVIKSIQEFRDRDISLKTLAVNLNMSPAYLGTLFKQQTGYYFNDYLTEARVQYAARLIETTDMKMKDIVDKVGFSSQTYFNRMFKQFYNLSPVTYRRNQKQEP